MPTGPQDQLRGNTPRRDTIEQPGTRPVRARTPREADPEAGTHAWLSPAARSEVLELLGEALTDRSASAESMIASRVKVDTDRGLKRYRGAVGGLVGALLGLGGWAVAEVRSYGDERVAAVRAEAKADEAAAAAQRVRDELDDARARVDKIEPKVDRALQLLEELASRPELDSPPTPIVVPRKPRPR